MSDPRPGGIMDIQEREDSDAKKLSMEVKEMMHILGVEPGLCGMFALQAEMMLACHVTAGKIAESICSKEASGNLVKAQAKAAAMIPEIRKLLFQNIRIGQGPQQTAVLSPDQVQQIMNFRGQF